MARRRQVEQLQAEIEQLRSLMPVEAFQGKTMASPFAESAPRRSILPWRRHEITEATPGPNGVKVPARAGYLADIPLGGANEFNQGYTQIGGATDRRTLLEQMQQVYQNCPWSAACVDTIARFCSAGGMSIDPDDESPERLEKVTLTPQAQKCQDLFDFVNPATNFRQLMRTIFTDLEIYGDAFVEVVWALGEPIALYPLPCPDMLIDADEHGNINFYIQRTATNRRAQFDPHEVIHIRLDSPRQGLYGLSPTEKAIHSIVTWIATEGLLKKTIERGNPPNIGIAWDLNAPHNTRKKYSEQYASRNLGPGNTGNPIEVIGKTEIHEFAQNKLAEYNAVKDKCRDEICGGYGCPPAIVTIIESGNLGGGTGSSQFKNFRVNTCGPLEELVLEAFTFYILEQGFGVQNMRCKFGEIDWRDDEVIENIRALRVRTAGWHVNRYRDDIGEPPVEGGTDPVFVLSRDIVRVKDIAAQAQQAALGPAAGPDTGLQGEPPAKGQPKPTDDDADPQADGKEPKHAKGSPGKTAKAAEAALDVLTEAALTEAWEADERERRRQVVLERRQRWAEEAS